MRQLAIGNDKNAIIIIQQSQTDPQKALAELIENSIDARASKIRIIRRRRGGKVELVIEDNGEGIKPGADGNPDFDRIARGICDSFKRQLNASQRKNVQGEYAIGMLGFAAIGSELEIISRTESSATRGMRLWAGTVNYETFVPRRRLSAQGTHVLVRGVHKEIQNRLTAERLSRYLGTELRDRIRRTKTQVRIEDRLPGGKTVAVRPREFEGETLAGIGPIKVAGGKVRFELYVTADRRDGRVGVARRGTRLVDDLCQIEELDHEPWNTGQIRGLIHFDLLTTAPASRKGIISDDRLREFLRAVQHVEKSVSARITQIEKDKEEELTRKLVRQIQEAFAAALDELTEDYSWFDGDRGGPLPGRRKAGPSKRREVRLSRGPLAAVEIVPRLAQLSPGESKRFTARPLDPSGALIPIDVEFTWRLQSPLAALTSDGPVAALQAGDSEGEGQLSITARQGSATAVADARFLILQVKKTARDRKLPFLEPVHRPSEVWRSRWVASRSVIEYNTGHPNYILAKNRPRKGIVRYLSLLVAKELVVHNFSGVQPNLLLERMVEVISALQQKL